MQIITNSNNREEKEHGSFSFPVYISVEQIQAYDQGTFLWHWHPEIELTWIMSGEMEYQINDTTYKLSAGDGVFGNSNSLHTGRKIYSLRSVIYTQKEICRAIHKPRHTPF